MFSNLKIGMRLSISFFLVILAVIAIWILSALQINNLTKQSKNNYDYYTAGIMNSYEIGNALSSIRILMRDVSLAQNIEKRQEKYDALGVSYNTLVERLNKYKNEILANSTEQLEKQYIDIIEENIRIYMEAVEVSKEVGLKNDIIGSAVDEFMTGYTQNAVNANTAMSQLIDFSNERASVANDDVQKKGARAILLLTIFLISAVLFAIALTIIVTKSITMPIGMLLKNTKSLADGSLDFKNSNSTIKTKDEIGELASSFTVIVNIIISILNEMDKMSLDHQKGEIDTFINTDNFSGVFNKVTKGINKMVEDHIKIKKIAISCINKIVNGNFSANIEQLPGKKSFVNEGIDNVRNKLKMLNNEIVSMTQYALNGDLTKSVDISKYPGDWSELMDGLNNMMQAVSEPLLEIGNVMEKVTSGDFSQTVKGDYKGEFLQLKNNVNGTLSYLSSYIDEVTQILEKLAQGNLNQRITKDYVGKFNNIKQSLNMIFDKLNEIIGSINLSSIEVSTDAKIVSQSSTKLAKGATEQAEAVDNLTFIIKKLDQKSKENADSAKMANDLSETSRHNITKGNDEMSKMLKAMGDIKESSNNISKIVQTIESIAFQTNLLALNAAVEAARAGVHGKGFAIVAEEVRNLALRSQDATKQTNDFINDSITKVSEGIKIAEDTAVSFNTISNGFEKVLEIISAIADSSSEQANSLSEINNGLNQISAVVQENSATSEKTASASEELFSQSEILTQAVNVFKLKK